MLLISKSLSKLISILCLRIFLTRLHLYKVDIPIKKGNKEPQNPVLDEEFLLDPADLLSNRLLNPLPGHIYIIAKTGM